MLPATIGAAGGAQVRGSNPPRSYLQIRAYDGIICILFRVLFLPANSHTLSGKVPQCGSLAQLVEHLTFNQVAAGSNPARPTISKCEVRRSKFDVLFDVCDARCNVRRDARCNV